MRRSAAQFGNKSLALALVPLFTLLVPAAGLAAKFELTEASNGFRRQFDSQIKANKFPRISMAWLVEGSFPAGSQRSIQCTASVRDAPPGVRPTARKGVKMTLRGEILDAATGNTLQVLDQQKKKTNQNGVAMIEFPLADVENF